jgi:hypothetical protein
MCPLLPGSDVAACLLASRPNQSAFGRNPLCCGNPLELKLVVGSEACLALLLVTECQRSVSEPGSGGCIARASE